MLLFRFDGVLLFRFAERQFDAVLFQLPPRFTRFEPESAPSPPAKNLPHHSNPTDCKIPLNPYQRAPLSAAAALARNCSPSISPVSHCRSLL